MKKKAAKSGFTLLEIMVVLVLLSMLLGIGIGAFSKVGSGPSLALGHIKNVVRTARFQAIRERAPSAVRVDPESNTVVGLGWKNVGCWHFEDVRVGASSGFPNEAVLGNTGIAEEGVIGRALDLTRERSGREANVFIPSAPSLDSLNGVSLECFVRLASPEPCTLLAKGRAYALVVNEEGLLEARLTLAKEKTSRNDPGEEVTLESASYVLPLNRWIRVGFQFNGYTFSVIADGIERAREQYNRRRFLYPHDRAPLVIGAGDGPFLGLMDELRIAAAVLGEEVQFHESIALQAKKSYTIHIDAKGHLDKNFHAHPVTIEFIQGGKNRYQVTVGLMGEVE